MAIFSWKKMKNLAIEFNTNQMTWYFFLFGQITFCSILLLTLLMSKRKNNKSEWDLCLSSTSVGRSWIDSILFRLIEIFFLFPTILIRPHGEVLTTKQTTRRRWSWRWWWRQKKKVSKRKKINKLCYSANKNSRSQKLKRHRRRRCCC